mmetsp:Transcript_5637/g.13671  ORF Transcript_5637/g.13671 Transcript_5637/m.13671 type:complete len:215 (+) Transcript_5637:1101-1745(+)
MLRTSVRIRSPAPSTDTGIFSPCSALLTCCMTYDRKNPTSNPSLCRPTSVRTSRVLSDVLAFTRKRTPSEVEHWTRLTNASFSSSDCNCTTCSVCRSFSKCSSPSRRARISLSMRNKVSDLYWVGVDVHTRRSTETCCCMTISNGSSAELGLSSTNASRLCIPSTSSLSINCGARDINSDPNVRHPLEQMNTPSPKRSPMSWSSKSASTPLSRA